MLLTFCVGRLSCRGGRNVFRSFHSRSIEKDPFDIKKISDGKYDTWLSRGSFKSEVESNGEKVFSMILPPPNVTGKLHIGHALTISIEDAFVRYYRMRKGFQAIWIPGSDHAGIATQTVVERNLYRNEKKNRHDLGREKFVERVWDWKRKYGGSILNQIQKLGASLNWEEEYFTLDEKRNKAVTEAFCQLFDSGLIYRANRMVNWCPTLRSTISDIETEHEEVEVPTRRKLVGVDGKSVEVGVIFTFKYPIQGTNEYLPVSTTRPETILGDTGVAVHPKDKRWQKYHGRSCVNPLNGRVIPIVTDSELVDMDFGTGVVKLTPGHDVNDYRAGEKAWSTCTEHSE